MKKSKKQKMLTSLVLPAKGEVNVASWSVRVERKHTSKNCQNEISGRNDPQDFPHWWPNSPNVTKNMSCQSSGTKLAICLKSVQSIQWDILCTQMQFPNSTVFYWNQTDTEPQFNGVKHT